MNIDSLHNLDQRHWIHPLSDWRAHEEHGAKILVSGRGVYVADDEGNELLDGFSGLWCVNIGYGNERVVEAAARQMRELPYATGYFGLSSEATIRFASELAAVAPGDCTRIFFTMGGSDAVDTAIRIVTFYNNARRQPDRKHFIALERGYHGSSSTSSGLTAIEVFHRGFDVPGQRQHHIPSPYPYRHPAGPEGSRIIEASVSALKAKVREIGEDKVAAFICEPIQGGGGIIVPPPGFLAAMREACRELGILFIADEVVTGFGRTGPMFACEDEGVDPDLMTVAKGLTSGYVPMGAVFVSEALYRGIVDNLPSGTPVGHGLTYSGHPVCSAVGLEVLRIYQEGLLDKAKETGAYFQSRLQELIDHPLVGEVRGRGMLAAIELVTDKKSKAQFDASSRVPAKLTEIGLRNKIIYRTFGDGTIGLAPPLCMTRAEVDILLSRLQKSIDDLDKLLHADKR